MQDRLVLNPNSKDRFALAEKFCYFEYAPAKSGVGIHTPDHSQRHLTFVCYGGLLWAVLVAGRISDCGSVNPLWPATISFTPNIGRILNKVRGTTMKTSWCLLGGICRKDINISNQIIVHSSLFLGVAK